MAKGAVGPVVPVLVALLTMAIEHKEGQAYIGSTILLIKTESMVGVPNLSHANYVRFPQACCYLHTKRDILGLV